MISLGWLGGCSASHTPREHSRPTPLKHPRFSYTQAVIRDVSKAVAHQAKEGISREMLAGFGNQPWPWETPHENLTSFKSGDIFASMCTKGQYNEPWDHWAWRLSGNCCCHIISPSAGLVVTDNGLSEFLPEACLLSHPRYLHSSPACVPCRAPATVADSIAMLSAHFTSPVFPSAIERDGDGS
jgi:hypothetical protein